MGVVTKILLILTLSFCVEAQNSIFLVDVEAKDDVEVFWSILNPVNIGTDVTYTVCYAINLPNSKDLTCPSTEDEVLEEDADNSTSILLTGIPPNSYVTVVIFANSSTGNLISSSVTKRTFIDVPVAGIPPPEEVILQRFDDNTILQVRWTAIDSPQILSYDIQYSLFDFQPIATINSPVSSNLVLDITGLDSDTSYQVRVRGVVEVSVTTEGDLIETQDGIWSQWFPSKPKLTTGASTSGGSISVYAACNGIIFITFLLVILLFF